MDKICVSVCTGTDSYSVDHQFMTAVLLNRFVPLIQVPHQNSLVPWCAEDPRTSWVTHHLSGSWGQNEQGRCVTGHSYTCISAHRRTIGVTLVTSRLWPWKDWHIRPCFQSYTTTACRDDDACHSHSLCLNFDSFTFTVLGVLVKSKVTNCP